MFKQIPNFSKFIICFVAVVAVVVAAASMWLFFSPSLPRATNSKNTTPTPQVSEQQQNQIVADIIAKNDLAGCVAVRGVITNGVDQEQICRNNIIFELAKREQSPARCKDVDGHLVQVGDCEQAVLQSLLSPSLASSPTTKTTLVCEQFTADAVRSACLATVASNSPASPSPLSSGSPCDAIKDATSRDSCRASVTWQKFISAPTTVSCRDLPLAFKTDCQLYQKAIDANKVGECFAIGSFPLRQACQERMSAQDSSVTQ